MRAVDDHIFQMVNGSVLGRRTGPIACLAVVLIAAITALPVWSQTYPDHLSISVNDYANLLPPAEKEALSKRLGALRRSHGVELTVVTLERMPDVPLEAFATGLFNDWGVGDVRRNDGVMVLILRDDRAMRIELGSGFGTGWDRVAEQVIDQHFLPAFSRGDYVGGIKDGTNATIEDIVIPFQAGQAPPSNDPSGIFVVLATLVGTVVFVLRIAIGNWWVRLKACPQCRQYGLRQTRETIVPPTPVSVGSGKQTVFCSRCDYKDVTYYTISKHSQQNTGRTSGGFSIRSGSGFGGGSSRGGGASGRW